jgi:hypothetical protein
MPCTASSLVFTSFFPKGTSTTHMMRADGVSTFGVDFWHAVEFSRNGRFLQDHFTGLSGRFARSYFVFFAFQLTRPFHRSVSLSCVPSSRSVSGPFRRVKL